jgi:hypothetical protein
VTTRLTQGRHWHAGGHRDGHGCRPGNPSVKFAIPRLSGVAAVTALPHWQLDSDARAWGSPTGMPSSGGSGASLFYRAGGGGPVPAHSKACPSHGPGGGVSIIPTRSPQACEAPQSQPRGGASRPPRSRDVRSRAHNERRPGAPWPAPRAGRAGGALRAVCRRAVRPPSASARRRAASAHRARRHPGRGVTPARHTGNPPFPRLYGGCLARRSPSAAQGRVAVPRVGRGAVRRASWNSANRRRTRAAERNPGERRERVGLPVPESTARPRLQRARRPMVVAMVVYEER